MSVSTLICSQSMRFRCFGKCMINSGPHYRFDAFSTVHARTFENDRITRRDASWTLDYTHASNTRASDIFGHRFHFDERLRPFSTIHTNKICMRFHFDPLSRVFSNRCVFIENTQRTGVDRRPKRTEMYAFSDEKALVWTRLKLVKTDWT